MHDGTFASSHSHRRSTIGCSTPSHAHAYSARISSSTSGKPDVPPGRKRTRSGGVWLMRTSSSTADFPRGALLRRRRVVQPSLGVVDRLADRDPTRARSITKKGRSNHFGSDSNHRTFGTRRSLFVVEDLQQPRLRLEERVAEQLVLGRGADPEDEVLGRRVRAVVQRWPGTGSSRSTARRGRGGSARSPSRSRDPAGCTSTARGPRRLRQGRDPCRTSSDLRAAVRGRRANVDQPHLLAPHRRPGAESPGVLVVAPGLDPVDPVVHQAVHGHHVRVRDRRDQPTDRVADRPRSRGRLRRGR